MYILICVVLLSLLLSKETEMPNSRQYGQMMQQRWEELERRRKEERESKERKSQKKEHASERNGRNKTETLCSSNALGLQMVEK